VWTRVVGYLRPVEDFHVGKKEEYKERLTYEIA
jgi:ribonucleoside-triphosphate reductase